MPLPISGVPKKHFDSQWFLQFRHVSLNEQKFSRFHLFTKSYLYTGALHLPDKATCYHGSQPSKRS